MTVADGTVVAIGYSATVVIGFYFSDHAQSLKQGVVQDFIEQSLAGTRSVVLDGMAAAIEVTFQVDFLVPVVQFNIAGKNEFS